MLEKDTSESPVVENVIGSEDERKKELHVQSNDENTREMQFAFSLILYLNIELKNEE